MARQPKSTTPGPVTVDRAALQALKRELAQERETARRLQKELVQEVEVARRAAEQTLGARQDREEYRRVLAAAVANEKRAEGEVLSAREATAGAEEARRAAEHARGEAEGRALELERQLEEERTRHARDVDRVNDRAWADAEAKGRELQRVQHERSLALGQVRELLRNVPEHTPASARVGALRARICLGAGLFTLALFLVFLAPLVVVLLGGEGATWPAMAGGLTGWTLFAIELALLGATVGLASWSVRDLRGVERVARAEASSRMETGGEAESPSAI